MALIRFQRDSRCCFRESHSVGMEVSRKLKAPTTTERTGETPAWAKTTGLILSGHGNLPGLQSAPAGIRWPSGRRTGAEIRNLTMAFGTPAGICGIRSSDKKSL